MNGTGQFLVGAIALSLALATPVAVCASGDLDADGVVDMADMALFIGLLLTQTGDVEEWCAADIGGPAGSGQRDGLVDGMDIQPFVDCFVGAICPPPPGGTVPGGSTAPPSGTFTLHGRPVDVLSDGLILQNNRARYYDPRHARWLHRDPSGYVDGANLYEAFGGNAGRNMDPEGEEIWVEADRRFSRRQDGTELLTVHYYLNQDAFSKGIWYGLLNYGGVKSDPLGTEQYVWPAPGRHRLIINGLIQSRVHITELMVEADADIGAQELALKFGVTGCIAAPVAIAVAPVAGALCSTTTIGITQATLFGNVAAASLTGAVSFGTGEAVSEAVIGGSSSDVRNAFSRGFVIGGLTGAPMGLASPRGFSSVIAAESSAFMPRRGWFEQTGRNIAARDIRLGRQALRAAGLTREEANETIRAFNTTTLTHGPFACPDILQPYPNPV